MEQFINDVTYRLSTKIPKENVEIVRNVLYIVLKDYELTQKCTEVAVRDKVLPRIAEIYLGCREVDGLSPNSIVQYRRTLNTFFSYTDKEVEQIKTEDLRLFFIEMQGRSKMSNHSLDNQKNNLSAFFKWLNDNEYITRNPMNPIKAFKFEKKVKDALSDMELEKIRKACKNNYERAIIEVLYSTAVRVNELVNIKLEDLDFEKGEVIVTHGKGNKQRKTYLTSKAILAIQEYTKDRDYPTVYLFENFRRPHGQLKPSAIEKNTRALQKRTGIELYPHKIRRTTATHLLRKGMPIEEIRILLGHENISTTMIYAKIDMDSVKRNHNKYLS